MPGWVYASLGYTFLGSLLLFHAAVYFTKLFETSALFPKYTLSPWQELSLLIGGPLLLLCSLGISFGSKKLCGAALLLGAALVSTGIAFESGYFLKTYIIRMLMLGVPQIVAGLLFLCAGKSKKKS